jgi:hypothetical protein
LRRHNGRQVTSRRQPHSRNKGGWSRQHNNVRCAGLHDARHNNLQLPSDGTRRRRPARRPTFTGRGVHCAQLARGGANQGAATSGIVAVGANTASQWERTVRAVRESGKSATRPPRHTRHCTLANNNNTHTHTHTHRATRKQTDDGPARPTCLHTQCACLMHYAKELHKGRVRSMCTNHWQGLDDDESIDGVGRRHTHKHKRTLDSGIHRCCCSHEQRAGRACCSTQAKETTAASQQQHSGGACSLTAHRAPGAQGDTRPNHSRVSHGAAATQSCRCCCCIHARCVVALPGHAPAPGCCCVAVAAFKENKNHPVPALLLEAAAARLRPAACATLVHQSTSGREVLLVHQSTSGREVLLKRGLLRFWSLLL